MSQPSTIKARSFTRATFGVTVFAGALLSWALSLNAAPTLVHVSQENYFPNGTAVTVSQDNFGSTDFTVGNASGTSLWEVTEKVWWDNAANQTTISYTTFNDAFSLNITSVHFPVPAGTLASSVTAPTGWTGAQMGNEIVWQTTGPGVPMFQSLDTMIVTYTGLLPIRFLPGAQVDFSDGSLLQNANWVVSSVPEPAALSLLALGGLLALCRRR